MAGIVGIARAGEVDSVAIATATIYHRGKGEVEIMELADATLGQVPSSIQCSPGSASDGVVLDGSIYNWKKISPGADSPQQAVRQAYEEQGPSFVQNLDGPFAIAMSLPDGLFLARDQVGISPLYYGSCEGATCFASEVKALVGLTSDVSEFPPGHYIAPDSKPVPFALVTSRPPLDVGPGEIAAKLSSLFDRSVQKRVVGCNAGCWLSGGLDSSMLTAYASKVITGLDTFAVGIEGAPDLEHARAVSDHLGTNHHELICTVNELSHVLPEVIYYLESFDAPLVRSSLTNYLLGKLSSDYVEVVLSGEGGDELFAGYDYLKSIKPDDLPEELVEITSKLHNTALQRVDRCSSAHGLVARLGFLDKDIIDYALSIPVDYKIRTNGRAVEKWILRRAADGLLPESVVERPKVKFWEGAGVSHLLADRAEQLISDTEYAANSLLNDGSHLKSKEEMLYYRIFHECFGEVDDISFVGRTKDVPPKRRRSE